MSFNIQELDQLQNRVVVDDHNIGENQAIIRSYDCVFCRRGFTTAQALGGHMNIHRKDRATTTMTKPSNNNSIVVDNSNNDQVDTTTRIFFSSKNYFNSSNYHDDNGGKSSFEGRFRDGSHMLARRVQDYDHNKDEEVDLELRLGHFPW